MTLTDISYRTASIDLDNDRINEINTDDKSRVYICGLFLV